VVTAEHVGGNPTSEKHPKFTPVRNPAWMSPSIVVVVNQKYMFVGVCVGDFDGDLDGECVASIFSTARRRRRRRRSILTTEDAQM